MLNKQQFMDFFTLYFACQTTHMLLYLCGEGFWGCMQPSNMFFFLLIFLFTINIHLKKKIKQLNINYKDRALCIRKRKKKTFSGVSASIIKWFRGLQSILFLLLLCCHYYGRYSFIQLHYVPSPLRIHLTHSPETKL